MRPFKLFFYTLAVLLCRGIARLPLPLWQRIARTLGSLLYSIGHKRVTVIRTNLRIACPELSDHDREQYVKMTAQNTVLGIFEAFFGWWGSTQSIQQFTTLEGLNHLDKALEPKKGVIILGAHFTSMELSAKVMGLQHKVNATYRRQNNPYLDDIVTQARQQHFNQLIEKSNTRSLLKSLKNGEAVWLSIDQDAGRKGAVFPTFFGQEAATVAIIDKLIKMTGAQVLFYSHFRSGLGKQTRYHGQLYPAIRFPENASSIEIAQIINHQLEDILQQHDITQYFWVHKRYKTRPTPDTPRRY